MKIYFTTEITITIKIIELFLDKMLRILSFALNSPQYMVFFYSAFDQAFIVFFIL